MWLSIAEEAKEASAIKNETPIMVIIGNPPYSVSSNNKSEWIQKLLKVYKDNLDEKNIQRDFIFQFVFSNFDELKTNFLILISEKLF